MASGGGTSSSGARGPDSSLGFWLHRTSPEWRPRRASVASGSFSWRQTASSRQHHNLTGSLTGRQPLSEHQDASYSSCSCIRHMAPRQLDENGGAKQEHEQRDGYEDQYHEEASTARRKRRDWPHQAARRVSCVTSPRAPISDNINCDSVRSSSSDSNCAYRDCNCGCCWHCGLNAEMLLTKARHASQSSSILTTTTSTLDSNSNINSNAIKCSDDPTTIKTLAPSHIIINNNNNNNNNNETTTTKSNTIDLSSHVTKLANTNTDTNNTSCVDDTNNINNTDNDNIVNVSSSLSNEKSEKSNRDDDIDHHHDKFYPTREAAAKNESSQSLSSSLAPLLLSPLMMMTNAREPVATKSACDPNRDIVAACVNKNNNNTTNDVATSEKEPSSSPAISTMMVGPINETYSDPNWSNVTSTNRSVCTSASGKTPISALGQRASSSSIHRSSSCIQFVPMHLQAASRDQHQYHNNSFHNNNNNIIKNKNNNNFHRPSQLKCFTSMSSESNAPIQQASPATSTTSTPDQKLHNSIDEPSPENDFDLAELNSMNRRNQVLLDLARMVFEEQSSIEQIVYRIMLHTQSLIGCQRCQVLLMDDGSEYLDQLLQQSPSSTLLQHSATTDADNNHNNPNIDHNQHNKNNEPITAFANSNTTTGTILCDQKELGTAQQQRQQHQQHVDVINRVGVSQSGLYRWRPQCCGGAHSNESHDPNDSSQPSSPIGPNHDESDATQVGVTHVEELESNQPKKPLFSLVFDLESSADDLVLHSSNTNTINHNNNTSDNSDYNCNYQHSSSSNHPPNNDSNANRTNHPKNNSQFQDHNTSILTNDYNQRINISLSNKNNNNHDQHHYQSTSSSSSSSTSSLSSSSPFPINIGITGYVARTGETVNIENAHNDPRFDPKVDEGSNFKHESILCMPIKNGQRQIIGVSQLINKKNGEKFTKNDESLFEAFSIFCGLGIHNTLMYEKVVKVMAKQRVTLEVLSYHATAPIEEALKLSLESVPSAYALNLNSLTFNDFSLDDQTMLKSCLRFFYDLDLVGRFQIDKLVLCNWILSVQKNYRNFTYHPIVGGSGLKPSPVTYHNWRHAFNVCQMMFAILTNTQICQALGELETLALVIACLCHDLDHRGTNNSFQIKSASPLAKLYSTSTMEHHHFDQCVMILNSQGNQILANLSPVEYSRVIVLVKEAILATDLANYFSRRDQFFHLVHNNQLEWRKNHEHRALLRCMLMTACDVAAITKPWPVQKAVADLVMGEFYQQGDIEKQELNMEPIDMMNREKISELPVMQMSFIDSICTPMYSAFAILFPDELPCLLAGCISNRMLWNNVAEERNKRYVINKPLQHNQSQNEQTTSLNHQSTTLNDD